MVRTRKRFGQNFLIDEGVIDRIVSVVGLSDSDRVLEIGPGTGNLTEGILKKNPKKVLVIEKDNNLTSLLKEKFKNKVEVINKDIKEGLQNIILNEDKIKELSEYAKRKEEISIDLNEEKIVYGNSETKFKVDSFKKKCLLEGLDDIALSLKKSDKIENFEKNLKEKKPWIFND